MQDKRLLGLKTGRQYNRKHRQKMRIALAHLIGEELEMQIKMIKEGVAKLNSITRWLMHTTHRYKEMY